MKILLFDNSGMISSGNDFLVETKTGNFAKELKNLGNEITFFGQKLSPFDNTVHVFGIKQNGMKVDGLKRRKNKVLNYFLLYLKVIPAVLKTDFVYIFYPTSFKYVAILSKLFGKKYGLYIRGMQGLNDRVSRWIYKNAYTIFTVSDYFTQFVNSIVGKNIANTIRPMIPFDEKDIVTNREYKEKDIYNILFLGRLNKEKGLEELLKAAYILKKQKKNFILTIVGDGEYMGKAKEIVNNLEIENLVNFTGAIYNSSEIKECYQNSDIYILPTYHEGFPRTLYEAMIFGLPIITTFVGGIPALMKNNYNCLEIKPKSVDSIVENLTWVINNYHQMEKFAIEASKTVTQVLGTKKFTHAEDLNNKLRELIK
jgi:glycosyltransferase involved in cell wall biosynthesis